MRSRARGWSTVANEVQAAFGVPITNKRISVTPIALVGEPTRAPRYVPLAETLDRAGAELGIDYVAGFSALVEKGITPGDAALIDSIPEALSTTQRVCSSINVATTRAGINMDAIAHMGRVIKALAERTADRGGIGCAKLVVFANIPDDNPFVAGAHARHRRGRLRDQRRRLAVRASCSRRSAGCARAGRSDRPRRHRRDDQAHGVQGHARRRADRPRGGARASATACASASSICRSRRRRPSAIRSPRSSRRSASSAPARPARPRRWRCSPTRSRRAA